MKITIGAFDPATRSVAATFADPASGIVHERPVNAVVDATGGYDEAATRDRVDAVGRGVRAKIAVGAILAPPPPAPEAQTVTAPKKSRRLPAKLAG
jgi:hypothetical protein